MALLPVLLLAGLASQQAGLSAEANSWGQAVDGMQMSVALVSESEQGPSIQITVKNSSNEPLLFPLGELVGGKFYTWKVHVFVSTALGRSEFWLSPGAVAAGRVDPVAIFLVPNSAYTLQKQLTELFKRGDSTGGEMGLPTLIGQPGRLWAEWEGDPPPALSSAAANLPVNRQTQGVRFDPIPRMIRSWAGKIVSNMVQLPR